MNARRFQVSKGVEVRKLRNNHFLAGEYGLLLLLLLATRRHYDYYYCTTNWQRNAFHCL
jgi:hypothetical protein